MTGPHTQSAVLDGRDRLFLAILGLIAVAYLALFGYYLGATVIRVPVYDLLGFIQHYADFWLRGDWWGYLWIPHNEHRLIFTRLLLLADIGWFRGNTVPFIVFGLLCLGGMTIVIAQEIMAAALPAGLRVMLVLIVLLLLATSYIVVDCTMPALGQYVHTAAFAVFALVLLDGAGEGGRHADLRRVLALLAGMAAAFGIAGGLIIWPVLLWAAWRGGLPRGWLIAVALTGIAFIAVYLLGLHSHASVGSLEPMRLLRMLDYSIRFLGLPWSHAAAFLWFGRAIGAVILLAGLFLLLRRGLLAPPRNRLERIALAMLLFALLMAALAGAGRVDIAVDREMPVRYSVFTAMAQVGLLILLAPWLGRLWSRRRRLLQICVIGAAVLMLAQQVVAGRAGCGGRGPIHRGLPAVRRRALDAGHGPVRPSGPQARRAGPGDRRQAGDLPDLLIRTHILPGTPGLGRLPRLAAYGKRAAHWREPWPSAATTSPPRSTTSTTRRISGMPTRRSPATCWRASSGWTAMT